MTVVVDASVLVAVLTGQDPVGERCAERMAGEHLVAPALLPFEAANVLRRLHLAGRLSAETRALAHADLLDLPVELWPYAAVASRVPKMTGSLSAYDATYVALADELDAPLLTLDARLGRSAKRAEVLA